MKLWFEKGGWASKKAQKKAAALKMEDVRSIAVIRYAALGDMVMLRAVLGEIRNHFPNASITLCLISHYMTGAPTDMVDRVHVVQGKDQKEASLLDKVKKIRELGYHDLIFDMAATSRSSWMCLLNPAKLKIGFPYRNFRKHLLYDIAVLRSDLKYEAETLLDMLNILGCKTEYPLDFHINIKADTRDRPYIIYFPTASIPYKCWPENNFSELISFAAEKYPDHDHLVMEGVREWESIDAIMDKIDNVKSVIPIKPKPLEDAMKLIKGADIIVCNDTGIRNVAIVLGVPTLGIFYKTVPFRYWPRFGNHDVVFMPEGGIPTVKMVSDNLDKMMLDVGKSTA